jgi:hypothetical protein
MFSGWHIGKEEEEKLNISVLIIMEPSTFYEQLYNDTQKDGN